ncbi:MAG: hypothetical protein ABII89_06690 [Candidatus Omnitrophota bacterium]
MGKRARGRPAERPTTEIEAPEVTQTQAPKNRKGFLFGLAGFIIFGLGILFFSRILSLHQHQIPYPPHPQTIPFSPPPPPPPPPPSYPVGSLPEAKSLSTQKNVIDTLPVDLSGEWKGTVVVRWITEPAQLFIKQTGLKLSGEINFENVEEYLEGEVKTDGQFFLRGTSYRRLSGEGPFHLDTFYGKVSKDGYSIAGNYEDAAGNKGNWDVSKVSGNTQKTEQKQTEKN